MAHETDLNVYPYHDDYDETKDFQKILFKPSVSVQTRELNQLQTLLLKQVERFGDHIFRTGTIVDGCNFSYFPQYPYIKIEDDENDGSVAVPSAYEGYIVKSSANLQALVIGYEDGFEAATPDLKTLYLRYTNSGNDNSQVFSPEDLLTVFDRRSLIHSVRVDNGGLGFSNSDEIVVTPQIVVNVSTGSFTNGEYVTQASLSSNLQIIGIDDTTLSLAGQVILTLRPRTADLANASVNTSIWDIANNESIRNVGNTAVATIEDILGTGAAGGIKTDASGRITNVVMTSMGSEYTSLPTVTVKSSNNSAGISALQLVPRNYVGQIRVAQGGTSVGDGYAFGVSNGVIYQKGMFLRVAEQRVVVSKYNTAPNAVAAVFNSAETIVDHNIDSTLNDPLAGDSYNAPGADRLKIVPYLEVVGVDELVPEALYFPIVEWNEGRPSKINQATAYSRIGDEMALRTKEAEGDFVLDRFEVSVRQDNNDATGELLSLVVDPGTAYVSGYRVSTEQNYAMSIEKGIDHELIESKVVSFNYGSYVRVKEFAGAFLFSTGDQVSLRSAASSALTGYTTGTISAPGTQLGTARIRSITWESGTPGTPEAIYRLYLFNVEMAAGKNFRNVRSVYYSGGDGAVADTVLQLDPITSSNIAVIREASNNTLLFPSGEESIKNANNLTYTYRTIDRTANVSNTGLLTKSIAASPDEFFVTTGILSDDYLQDFMVVPLVDIRAAANLSGTVSVNTTSPNVVGTSTSFISEIEVGDYLYMSGNSTQNGHSRVLRVVNNTLAILSANADFTNAAAAAYRAFPKNVPVPFGSRDGLNGNVDSNGNVLVLNFGFNLAGSTTSNAALVYNVLRSNVGVGTKTANRATYVKIRIANNAGGEGGPWCLGVPDGFRMTGAWMYNDSTVNTSSLSVIDDFLIDTNHTASVAGLSWIYKHPWSTLNVSSDDWYLFRIDHFTSSGTVFATPSYVSANSTQQLIMDASNYANLGTSVATYEIPGITDATNRAKKYDLINHFDFRPIVSNTAAYAKTVAAATVNPPATVSFGNTADPANDKKFPLPMTSLVANVDVWSGRKDTVVIGIDGNMNLLRGEHNIDPKKRTAPKAPANTILLDVIDVPPYPTLPSFGANFDANLHSIMGMRRHINGINDFVRWNAWRAKTTLSPDDRDRNQPKRYTQKDIGGLERRVEALEYYTALTLLELDIKDKTIPSSVDASLNRFKYGFFVDDFNDESKLDEGNPYHTATIEKGDMLVPEKMNWSVNQEAFDYVVPPYIHHGIVKQSYATVPFPNTQPPSGNGTPGNRLPPGNTGGGDGGGANNDLPPGNCVTNTTATNTYVFMAETSYDALVLQPVKVKKITMANAAGPVSISFDVYRRSMAIEVYKGNTLIYTANNATDLTAADKTKLRSNTYSGWFAAATFRPKSTVTTGGDTLISGSGKITWNHDPTTGRNYTIRIKQPVHLVSYRLVGEYPLSSNSYQCDPPPPKPPTVVYDGTLYATEIPAGWDTTGNTYVKFPESYRIDCYGLKPLTIHAVKVDGVLITNGSSITNTGIFPINSTAGVVKTNNEGRVSFMYKPIDRPTRPPGGGGGGGGGGGDGGFGLSVGVPTSSGPPTSSPKTNGFMSGKTPAPQSEPDDPNPDPPQLPPRPLPLFRVYANNSVAEGKAIRPPPPPERP